MIQRSESGPKPTNHLRKTHQRDVPNSCQRACDLPAEVMQAGRLRIKREKLLLEVVERLGDQAEGRPAFPNQRLPK